jgi:hypothetical protein
MQLRIHHDETFDAIDAAVAETAHALGGADELVIEPSLEAILSA